MRLPTILLWSTGLLLLLLLSCNTLKSDQMKIEGTLQEQGITFYQYGTHTLAGYALKSEFINLDDYIGQEVEVIGHKVAGYPLEGGPDLIEVDKIKRK